MSVKLGINGFGRIGRLVFRAAFKKPNVMITAINDPFMTLDLLAYLLKYDSVHGRFNKSIEVDKANSALIVDGNKIQVYTSMKPEEIPWGESNSTYVIESTGIFLAKDKANSHLKAGAKKVILSAPPKDDTPMFVMGVNNEK